MPRIRPLKEDEVSPDLQGFFKSDVKNNGVVFHSTGIQAYCPPILKGMKALGGAIPQSGLLPQSLQRIVNLKAASMVGCPF